VRTLEKIIGYQKCGNFVESVGEIGQKEESAILIECYEVLAASFINLPGNLHAIDRL
jgi:hypothetical protein